MEYTYEFYGWTPHLEVVKQDVTYQAIYSVHDRIYTVKWADGDGNVLETMELSYGSMPSYDGPTPTKTATPQYEYTFNNRWSPEIGPVTKDVTYVAQFNSTPLGPVEPSKPSGGNQGTQEIIINPDGSETKRTTNTTYNPDGSVTTNVKETTTDADGSRTSRTSRTTEKADGSSSGEVWETVTNKDGSSSSTHSIHMETIVEDGSSVIEVITTMDLTDLSGNELHIETDVRSEADQSGNRTLSERTVSESGNEHLVIDTFTVTSPDGKETSSRTIESTIEGDVTITTTGSTESGSVETVITVYEGDVIDPVNMESAMNDMDRVRELLGADNVSSSMVIERSRQAAVGITPQALGVLADADMGLEISFGVCSLTYDSDALSTMSRLPGDVSITMTINDKSALDEAQRQTVGGSTFVSVVAMSEGIYLSDLNGSVTISFPFDNPKGWKEFAVYYIDDDGGRKAVDWKYGDGQITVVSGHHSIYAVLETSSGAMMIWIAVGAVLAVIAVAAVFLILRSGHKS